MTSQGIPAIQTALPADWDDIAMITTQEYPGHDSKPELPGGSTKARFTSLSMKTPQRPGTALVGVSALGLILMGAPARADELQSLKQQLEAIQQRIERLEKSQATQQKAQKELKTRVDEGTVSPATVVTAGDFKGSFKLPGTDTSFSIFGYVKGDVIVSSRSAGGQNAIGDQFLVPSAIPVGPTAGANEKNQTTFTARQSRLGVRSSTPTSYGPLSTLLEVDFYGPGLGGGQTLAGSAGDELVSNRNAPSLRHAYGTLGNLGVGQFWTAFENQAAIPDILDFGGPVGIIFIRQTQVRWTQPFQGGNWEVSLENPETAIANDAALLRPDDDRYPDIVGRVNLLKTSSGDFWGSVLVRNIRIDQPGATDNQWGAALQLGGIIPITSAGRDDFRFVINYGNVVGRYQELGFFPDGILVNNQIELSDVVSGFVSYRHFWSPNWRSNLVLSASYADHPGGTAGTINKEARSAHLNLIWSSIASVNLGVEYIYGYRRTQNGFSGNLNRLQFSGQYSF